MIDVICWKWKPFDGYRSYFGPEQVNVLRNMVSRNLSLPHRFTCITDDPAGIDSDIRIIPLWDDYADLPNANCKGGPSCYRRLKAFSTWAKEAIGERILSIDLDCVITGDITPLVDRQEDFICWGDTARGTHYNGGLWLLRAGTRAHVWDTFDPILSPITTREHMIIGSDQAWISYVINGTDPKWGADDGVYSFRNHIQRSRSTALPDNARVIMFHGGFDPWIPEIQARYEWVQEHYV